MKFKLWNRLLAALSGLILFAMGACLVLLAIGFVPVKVETVAAMAASLALWQRVVMACVGLLVCLLGFHDMWMLFRRRGEKGFIMQRTDLGDMSISMNALQTMVHKCVDQHRELTVRSTRIFRVKNGIVVEIRIILATGVNIPLTVSALQKQIKQYIAACSGVEVYEVRVLVETNLVKQGHGKERKELVLDARKPVNDGTLPDDVVHHAADPGAENAVPPTVHSEPTAAVQMAGATVSEKPLDGAAGYAEETTPEAEAPVDETEDGPATETPDAADAEERPFSFSDDQTKEGADQ